MRSLIAFMKKEAMSQLRTGKLFIVLGVFVLLGVMNVAVAKLTPWILGLFKDALAESGMNITEMTVSAMDSWAQYYKNLPMGVIVFVVLQGTAFTKEYRSGTLVLSLTKGLERFKVVVAKASMLFVVWSLCYWSCFGVTCLGNACFWDNSVASALMFSAVCWWLFGVFIVALMTLLSTIFSSSAWVLLGTGGGVLISYIIGLIPKVGKYLPTFLTNGTSLIYGMVQPKEYLVSILITAVLTVVCFVVSVPLFNKKQL